MGKILQFIPYKYRLKKSDGRYSETLYGLLQRFSTACSNGEAADKLQAYDSLIDFIKAGQKENECLYFIMVKRPESGRIEAKLYQGEDLKWYTGAFTSIKEAYYSSELMESDEKRCFEGIREFSIPELIKSAAETKEIEGFVLNPNSNTEVVFHYSDFIQRKFI